MPDTRQQENFDSERTSSTRESKFSDNEVDGNLEEFSKIGVIGLAVMGANLARNIASRGNKCSVYNRTTTKTEEFIKEFGEENLQGTKTLEEFVESLEKPRKILIMVNSSAIDTVMAQLTPLLDNDDIIIDGGNSNYHDTLRRQKEWPNFIGMGVSGGEEGALHGPSMMPGGSKQAYEAIEAIFLPTAADDGIGGKCFTHIGQGGSGHFVKMVHNGIEYGIMQLIAEIYDLLRKVGKLSNEEMQKLFEQWSKEENSTSFLVEITATIFKKGDILDKIKDQAKQKGTGKWTTFAAMDYGVSTPTINAAVDARIISGDSKQRQRQLIQKHLKITLPENLKELAKSALDLATICTYNQGFQLMRQASEEYDWNLNLSEIARIWRGGCIIRSDQLGKWADAFSDNNEKSIKASETIVLNFEKQDQWREFLTLGIANGIPMPALSASLAYYDALAADNLPQNLTQAQRDFFGAHSYERTDQEGTFHTNWEE
ncbi:NADP-dependent phosphogluconate dehydrogenase [Candidatus Gracilibacteria bacterium]|nr:NADP-dependent phosphogluconate dehydrogenase [Candidatus Gracilibacteria bacterium]